MFTVVCAVRVAVLPVELVRLDPDRQVRLVFDAPCLHRRDLGEGEDRERREDDRGDRRPDDLEPGVAVDLRPLGALGRVASAAEADDEEDERRLDEDEDDRAEAEDDPVETRDRLAARGVGARADRDPREPRTRTPRRTPRARRLRQRQRASGASSEGILFGRIPRTGELRFTRFVVQCKTRIYLVRGASPGVGSRVWEGFARRGGARSRLQPQWMKPGSCPFRLRCRSRSRCS